MMTENHELPNAPMCQLSSAEESQLCALIQQRLGIVIHDHQKENLAQAAKRACQRFGYGSYSEYFQGLALGGSNSFILKQLAMDVTVTESYFFRDDEQFRFLEKTQLPQLIEKKRLVDDKSLSIWSAGCAQGQEIYSIAILLHELLPDIDSWDIRLFGSDINTDCLIDAARGRFNKWSLRATSTQRQHDYFVPVGEGTELVAHIRQRVSFAYINLIEDRHTNLIADIAPLDLILCRNVFIYLEQSVVQRIMHRFSQSLADDGVLLLGAADLVETPPEWQAHYDDAGRSYLMRRMCSGNELVSRNVLWADGGSYKSIDYARL